MTRDYDESSSEASDVSLNKIEDDEFINDINDTSTRFCGSCGIEAREDQRFCSKCGASLKGQIKNNKIKLFVKNLNKKDLGLILLAVFLTIFTVFYTINQENIKAAEIEAQKIEEEQALLLENRASYVGNIETFVDKIYLAGANLEDIADTTQKYWHENIYEDKHGSDINEAIFAAMLSKSSEITTAKTYDGELLDLYSNLQVVPEGCEDLQEMVNKIGELYNSYSDFYSLATDPNGNYNQYSSNNNSRTDEFLSSYRAVENMVKTNSEFTVE
ncbi:zinc ribbon domain-containing protein [Metaclostridioides mangenotii]|uniref:zinc ribbon domain-containing protein n=1 Tax=Metaclostridioides mangenotii TaxID=1540 RepID=UPI0004667E55|nr:zinc ribbon domain-containing protein [Clostridioides mangenotii]